METIIIDHNLKEIKQNLPELEKKLKVKITLEGTKLTLEGEAVDEYEATMIIYALNFGFTTKQALQIKGGEMSFRKVNIKEFTTRPNLYEVRARIIGKEGKVKRTIQDLSGADMIIKGNEIGIIGNAESIQDLLTGLSNLIRGSKTSNVYSFLERMNADKKKFDN